MNRHCMTGETIPGATGLPVICRHARIQDVALSKRQGWWTKHPRAVTHVGKSDTHPPISGTLPGIHPFLGGHGSGAKENASPCACLRERCFAATRSTLRQTHVGTFPMIYTFLIAAYRGRLADIPRIRTLSVYATSEAQARANLAGLPLVFLSRCPARIEGGRTNG